ncbi:MAG: tandem-95 repeat protein [Saprospirales bacterium]|nr:tandem-95 repeat protein [Saprospirales bacterium]
MIPEAVTPVNNPPVANDDYYSTNEDTPLIVNAPGILVNDSDPNMDPLTITVLTPPLHGTLTQNPNGSFTYTPDLNYNGPDSYTYQVCDPYLACDPATVYITIDPVIDLPVATDNESLANPPGPVTQEVILEDDGYGSDYDPDGSLVASSIDLDPGTGGQQTTLTVPGEGTWTVDGSGNVTFTPDPGFNDDPTPITYTIDDNDGNTSNTATIVVDYVPVATDDVSTGNVTNTPVTVDVLANDLTGDIVDPTTVQIVGTANPGDALVVPGEGTWTVNPTTGAITFTPQPGFTADPTDITYTVKDGEGNTSNPATVHIDYDVQPPVATNNESLANPAGPVTQQVITEDDGYGVDNDPDGSLVAGSIDLDPGTGGQQTTLVVTGEGTWTVDGSGNVTFTPDPGFNDDPTPITYTIDDNDGNTSNTATIVVDYVPVATDDVSTGNTTNTPVTVDVLANDLTGDIVDPTTVQIVGTANPGDPLTVPGEGPGR